MSKGPKDRVQSELQPLLWMVDFGFESKPRYLLAPRLWANYVLSLVSASSFVKWG